MADGNEELGGDNGEGGTFSAEDLARMTPAEREAVTSADDDSDTVLDGEEDEDQPAVAAAKPAGEAEAVAAKPAAEQAEELPSDSGGAAPFVVAKIENFDQQVETLEAKKDDAFKKLMEGEMSDADYRKLDREVSREIRELQDQQIEARIATNMTQQAAKNAWIDYVGIQLDAEVKDGVNMMEHMEELDRTVKLLAGQMKDNPDMVKHLAPTRPGALITNPDKWALKEAMEIVKTRNSLVGKAAIEDINKKGDGKAKTKAGTAPNLTNLPPSLSRVPAAADPATGGDEFAHLANLNGTAYEKALAKLSPDQLERFMN